jgi:hypothetical protein
MTAQEAERLKIGDRVQSGTSTGIVEFVVSNVFVVKWDGRRDSDAFTRKAFEKQFVLYNPRREAMAAASRAAAGTFFILRSPSVQPR